VVVDDEDEEVSPEASSAFLLPLGFPVGTSRVSSSLPPVRIALGAPCTMRISVTLGMSAAANWQKSATDSSIGTASTQTIGDLPSGNEAGAFVTIVVVVAADDDDDADATDAHTASR
jgi:hypothetical protein